MTDTWLRSYAPSPGASSVLVCLPHAGGSATFCLPAARQAAQWADVLAVQYPGRQDRRAEPCLDSINGLADGVAEALSQENARPISLFGHSMGALVAYEVARRLEPMGVVPLSLFVSGRSAPSMSRDNGVHRLSEAELLAEIRRLGGTATTALDEDLMRAALPAIRADYRALETYRHIAEPRLSCPVYALLGEEDREVAPQAASAWRDHTDGPFGLFTFPGGHFYLIDHVSNVLELLRTRTADALQARHGHPSGAGR